MKEEGCNSFEEQGPKADSTGKQTQRSTRELF